MADLRQQIWREYQRKKVAQAGRNWAIIGFDGEQHQCWQVKQQLELQKELADFF